MEIVFTSLIHDNLDNVFLSLKKAMIGATSVNGYNTYNINYTVKVKLWRDGTLTVLIQCDADILITVINLLKKIMIFKYTF